MNDYEPIACAQHDRFEAAILHRQPLWARWLDASGERHEGILLPLDLLVEAGAEYLVARGGRGQSLRLRLDRIQLSGSGA